MRYLVVLLLSLAGLSFAAESTAVLTKNSVSATITSEQSGDGLVLVGHFAPAKPNLHLYGLSLPKDGPGIATRLELADGAPATTRGELTVDLATHDADGLAVFDVGAAPTLRLPITLPAGNGATTRALTVLVSWMACTDNSCLAPVQRKPLTLVVPADPARFDAATTSSAAPAPALDETKLISLIDASIERALSKHTQTGGIPWRKPADVAQLEQTIAEAHAAGKPALLDFTGPSCVVCLEMKRTVFVLPEIRAAWASGVPISVNTDPPHEALAEWQQTHVRTQARPVYAFIAPGHEPLIWTQPFSPSDTQQVAALAAFLRTGAGGHAPGDSVATNDSGSLWTFVLLAIGGGLFTLLMPCTYPMIPFTVNFFAKQAASGVRTLPLAIFYGGGIIASFVGLGLLIVGALGSSLASVSGHPVTNLAIALLFLVLGASLLGVFFLRPPAFLANAMGGGRGGYIGALIMGLTFAVTAFTCTAPFAGTVLAGAVTSGAWGKALLGMTIYGATIAIPFIALALAPKLLTRLPKAGAWMNEFKVVGGLVEICAALKFLAVADAAWGWHIVGRTLSIAVWAAAAIAVAVYLLGLWRTAHDDRVEHVGAVRLLIALAFLATGLWFTAGLAGGSLGVIESFFPS